MSRLWALFLCLSWMKVLTYYVAGWTVGKTSITSVYYSVYYSRISITIFLTYSGKLPPIRSLCMFLCCYTNILLIHGNSTLHRSSCFCHISIYISKIRKIQIWSNRALWKRNFSLQRVIFYFWENQIFLVWWTSPNPRILTEKYSFYQAKLHLRMPLWRCEAHITNIIRY